MVDRSCIFSGAPAVRRLGTASLLTVLLATAVASAAEPADEIDFSRDIRPILSNKCFQCHGPDEAAREAGLRLDTAEGATADLGGYRAVDPQDPAASALLVRVTAEDAAERMPPPDSGLKLKPEEVELLRRWIEQGAEFDQHWAFRPINRPAVPAVETSNNNAIDAFVLAKLHANRLTPSAEAARSTLIRRVYLDLLGLPPAPDEVARFLADEAPDAYERMVDRVLANPHYGERWGRHWLDQARYADTNGYTIGSERSMWPYRDWVIRALNEDMPFDQFTIEQLAGDLLDDPSQSQLVATGFHRNTLINQEGGTDREQFRNEAVVDRVNTTGSVWLGLTVGCAQCHTHKFDPISHREYYQLFAFFNSCQDVNSTAPTIHVATAAQQQRLAEFDAQIQVASQALAEYDRRKNEQLAESERNDGEPVQWAVVDVEATSAGGADFERLDDGSLVASGENAASDVYTLRFQSPHKRITAVRLETLTHPSLPKGGPGRASNGNFVLNEVVLRSENQTADWLHALADHSQPNYDVAGAVDGDATSGWAINGAKGPLNVSRTATLVASELPTPDGSPVTLELHFGAQPPHYNLGRLRIAVTDAPRSKLDLPDPERAELLAEKARLEAERKKYAASFPETMIMRELSEPRETHILIRGDFLRKGDSVTAKTPAVLPPLSSTENQPTRLELARWIVDRQNPLTARVTVNRIWSRYFGQGLVETENDFGLQGTAPTHPQLLDWLAAEFMDGGWSLKRLHRLIVTSATYRQSSQYRADLAAADPLNKLLGRQQRLRVEAEVVRDLALAVSGLLQDRIGGPSVYPPQPDGVYAFTQRNASWPTSQGADRFRRGMYTFFMRSAPYPMLTTFDTPRFNTTCTRRTTSNTPLQSLTLANDQTMIEFARAFGRRLQRHPAATRERLEYAFQLCYARSPMPVELERLSDYFQRQREDFAAAPEDARRVAGATEEESEQAELAAWTLVARLLLNLDEFITRE